MFHSNKIILFLCAICGLVCMVAVWGGSEQEAFYFIDVGQGDASAFVLGNAVFMVDAGGDGERVAQELDAILPVFGRRVDVVFISHPQRDHMGGLISLVRRFGVRAVLLYEQDVPLWNETKTRLEDAGVVVINMDQGDSVHYRGDVFKALWPPRDIDDINNASLVLSYTNSDGFRALFTGDISSQIERFLLRVIDAVTLLKVAHHGSKYSSSQEFLSHVTPSVSFIGVGKNSYGHPTQEVLDRLASVGSSVFRTDQEGTMRVVWKDGELEVQKISR